MCAYARPNLHKFDIKFVRWYIQELAPQIPNSYTHPHHFEAVSLNCAYRSDSAWFPLAMYLVRSSPEVKLDISYNVTTGHKSIQSCYLGGFNNLLLSPVIMDKVYLWIEEY